MKLPPLEAIFRKHHCADFKWIKSRDIVVTAIQRYATEHTSASTVSTVDIPSDDMKGRVIGREGRTAHALRALLGAVAAAEGGRAILEIAD